LREGVLKVKGLKRVYGHEIAAGINQGNPEAFEKAIRDSFEADHTELFGDVDKQIAHARMEQQIAFVHMMHHEHGKDWFENLQAAEGPFGMARSSTANAPMRNLIDTVEKIFMTGEINDIGPFGSILAFGQSYLKLQHVQNLHALNKLSPETISRLQEGMAQINTASQPIPVPMPTEVPVAAAPVAPVAEAVAQSAAVHDDLQAGRAAAAAEATTERVFEQQVETAAKSAGKKNHWLGAGIAAAATLGGGSLLFSHPTPPRKDIATSNSGGGVRHRIIPDDTQGYNIQINAKDDNSRPVEMYGKNTAAGVGGQLQVHVEDNRGNLKDQQQENTIKALKGR
jgi:hypothetical protein